MSPARSIDIDRIHIVLERVDPAENMARYYVLSVEPTLFGNSALVREWGRIGSPGRRSQFFDQVAEAHIALDTWLARKTRRGYVARRMRP
jgi:predicted DNA-binding WGR domain protein